MNWNILFFFQGEEGEIIVEMCENIGQLKIEVSEKIGQLDFEPHVEFVRLKITTKMEHRDFIVNVVPSVCQRGWQIATPLYG